MKKAMITMATVTVVGIGSTFFTNSVQAETINDLENKQSQIESERSEIKENLSKAEAEIADVMIDLEELNDEINKVEDALKANEEMIAETNVEIATKEEQVAELEKAIEKRSDILKDRMVSYQKNGGNIGFLDIIFGSKSFGDFVGRVSAVTKITESDGDLIRQQEEDKASVESKLTELTEMQVELEGMQELILVQKAQNEEQKEQLNKKEKQLTAKKEELQIKDSNLASIEAQVRQSIAAKRTPIVASSATNNSSGGELTTLSKKENKTSAPVAASGSLSTVINAGYQYLGVPYVWAGKGPSGFDCSGFVSWAYAQGGYSIPSSTSSLQSVGTKVSYSEAKPGDIVFFNTYKTNGHVGIYLGNGKFIGAQNKTGLAVADMSSGYWKNHFAGHVRRVVK